MFVKPMRPLMFGSRVIAAGVIMQVNDIHGKELVAKGYVEESDEKEFQAAGDDAVDATESEAEVPATTTKSTAKATTSKTATKAADETKAE